MTNFEHYEESIKKFMLEHGHVNFGVKEGEIIECCVNDCDKCEINPARGMCIGLRKKWLTQEHNTFTIPLDTPVDTKVLVSDNGKVWYKRYFSHFSEKEKSPYACFGDGSNSWSAKGIYEWRYCKLWEGYKDETN